MKGNVKFFNNEKGFGFISAEDGKEYFVHKTGLNEGTSINENDPVEFDVEQGDRGPKAVNVREAGAESADEPEEESSEEDNTEEAESQEETEEDNTEE